MQWFLFLLFFFFSKSYNRLSVFSMVIDASHIFFSCSLGFSPPTSNLTPPIGSPASLQNPGQSGAAAHFALGGCLEWNSGTGNRTLGAVKMPVVTLMTFVMLAFLCFFPLGKTLENM